MARVFPSDWESLEDSGPWPAEGETLKHLLQALPDDLVVFHGVHWTKATRHFTVFGEIDFCVVNAVGRVLAIEQKNGFLREGPEGLEKHYGRRTKSVSQQVQRNRANLQHKFALANPAASPLDVDYLVYLPDYRVKRINAAGLDPRRIVDASGRDRLADQIVEILHDDALPDEAHCQAVLAFLQDTLEIAPDTNAFLDASAKTYTRLTSGLSEWVKALEFSPFRLHVIGTAGSGKTQLALEEYRRAIALGRRPAFVCFNEPLAARFRQVAPAGGLVTTFHALCRVIVDPGGEHHNFAQMDSASWAALVADAMARSGDAKYRFDSLIVDEAQDMEAGWVPWLLTLVRPEGRLLWLDDPLQNIYGRDPAPLGDHFVALHARTNYRSPQAICEVINTLLALEEPLCCGSPNPGSDVVFHEYANEDDLVEQTERRLVALAGEGYGWDDIAIVSYRGRDKSLFRRVGSIGDLRLKKFEGAYDALGQQVLCPGDIRYETVFRFKGHQAPVVLFTEIDFETFNESVRRRLFCGMTRASLQLEMFVGPAGSAALRAHLAGQRQGR